MNVESNLLLPYDYYVNDSNVYIFSTVSGAKYTAYFIEMSFFESCKLYSFSFEKENGYGFYDKRISITIFQIIKDFFEKNTDSLIFTCENSDRKHGFRNVLFRRWFNSYSGKEYIKHDKEQDDLIISIILQTDNPLKDIILEEFDDIFNQLNT